MIKLTDSEIDVMQLLWQHNPCSVRFINDELNKHRKVGYTTTLKIMQIMYEKGLVSRDTSNRSHLYSPLIKEKDTKRDLLKGFIASTFRGSMSDLVLSAIGHGDVTRSELEEIKSIIEDIENKQL